MIIKNITVAGGGVLGSQIAFQISLKGFNVNIYDINDQAIEKGNNNLLKCKDQYLTDMNTSFEEKFLNEAINKINFFSDLKSAVSTADLVIEAIPEIIDMKQSFFSQLSLFAPKHTIFTTNSSTLLPSDIVRYTDRKEKFLAFHFANQIWLHNTVEIMPHTETSHEVIQLMISFAKSIGMIPIKLEKEQKGYLLNSLLVPLLDAALDLLTNEVSDAKSIDKTWMIATGSPVGPCAMLDLIGIGTVYNIKEAKYHKLKDQKDLNTLNYLKKNFLDKGYLGKNTGQGFYHYPNPEYEQDNFLR